MSQKATQTEKNGSYVRWIALLLISLVIFANYYVFRALSPIKTVLMSQFDFSNADYGIIVSFYSITNIFMCILGGILLDKWGIKKTGYLFFSLTVIGIFVTAFGASEYFYTGGFGYGIMGSFFTDWSPEFKMFALGRLLFGLGSETSLVVINKVLVKWFKGKDLALAFGLNLAIARLGDATALLISDNFIASSTDIGNALWAAFLIMSTGFILWVIYSVFDAVKTEQSVKDAAKVSEEEKFNWSDLGKLFTNKSFILITLLCVIFYSAVFPFLDYAPDFLYNKFNIPLNQAGALASIIVFGTIVFTPIFGYVSDKYGRRASLMVLGSGLLVVVHLVFGLTHITAYIPLFVLGIAFSLVPAAMWPAVALIVPEKRLGTAYGTMFAIQNIGLLTFPILAGVVLDAANPGISADAVAKGKEFYDYTWTMIMFAGLGLLGFLFAFMLKKEDAGPNSHGLEKPQKF